jgi:hypothetical protein
MAVFLARQRNRRREGVDARGVLRYMLRYNANGPP